MNVLAVDQIGQKACRILTKESSWLESTCETSLSINLALCTAASLCWAHEATRIFHYLKSLFVGLDLTLCGLRSRSPRGRLEQDGRVFGSALWIRCGSTSLDGRGVKPTRMTQDEGKTLSQVRQMVVYDQICGQ